MADQAAHNLRRFAPLRIVLPQTRGTPLPREEDRAMLANVPVVPCRVPYHTGDSITHPTPLRRISRLVFSTTEKVQTLSNASVLEISRRRHLPTATILVAVVPPPPGLEKLG